MKLVSGIVIGWQQLACHHHWVRARWEDGSYGFRCAQCMKPYPRTWNDIVAGGAGAAGRPLKRAA
jgi:hypothetical protein